MYFVQLAKCFKKCESLANIKLLNTFNKNSGFRLPLKNQKVRHSPLATGGWRPVVAGPLDPHLVGTCVPQFPWYPWCSLHLPNIEAVTNHYSCFDDILWVHLVTLSAHLDLGPLT